MEIVPSPALVSSDFFAALRNAHGARGTDRRGYSPEKTPFPISCNRRRIERYALVRAVGAGYNWSRLAFRNPFPAPGARHVPGHAAPRRRLPPPGPEVPTGAPPAPVRRGNGGASPALDGGGHPGRTHVPGA